MKIARSYTPDTLPDYNAKSLHYNFICKPNVVSNFRVLAAFSGYVHLLEVIMMIFFQSCPHPQRNSRFMDVESYEIMRTLRTDADIPESSGLD